MIHSCKVSSFSGADLIFPLRTDPARMLVWVGDREGIWPGNGSQQIVAILHEAEKAPTNDEVLRKHGFSERTFYRWKRMYGNLGTVEVQRIKQLEKENRKLKQLAGDQALAIQVL